MRERLSRVFAEKEVFFRTHGKVRFLRIGSRVQIAIASLLVLLCAAWLTATLAMIYNQTAVAHDRAAVDAKAEKIAVEARKVETYRRSVSDIAEDLDHRQDLLDDMVRSQFGPAGDNPDVIGAPDEKTQARDKNREDDRLSATAPGVEKLQAMEHRQTRFAKRLAALIDRRADKAEAAIRSFGLNPAQIAARSRRAQGGPYIPLSREDTADDEALAGLASALARLNALEQGLIAIPSGRPTAAPMLSSSYGYRRDPFNGRAAFHSGVDFRGRYGQPILAAAAGRISYVGTKQGYGRVVEIDHGNGIMTRYAHLSSFTVTPGQKVTRGDAVARMGSTGRSTGTHLHFEVRVNGAAINPRRFLEARQDVLKVQQIAKQRFARVRAESVKSSGRG